MSVDVKQTLQVSLYAAGHVGDALQLTFSLGLI